MKPVALCRMLAARVLHSPGIGTILRTGRPAAADFHLSPNDRRGTIQRSTVVRELIAKTAIQFSESFELDGGGARVGHDAGAVCGDGARRDCHQRAGVRLNACIGIAC